MKYLILPILALLLVSNSAGQSSEQENHLREAGTTALFTRSPFAHGYRHGYEEGYHLGNMDVNMGRHSRTKQSDFHGISLRYSSAFGPKKSFETGFHDGLWAGYSDGFLGRKFRAVATLRSIANALDQNPAPADPSNVYFDQGVSAGYDHGRNQVRKDLYPTEELGIELSSCGLLQPSRQYYGAAQGSFCDGYRRGYLLGQADAAVQGSDFPLSARQ
jgi:hypothetical protein